MTLDDLAELLVSRFTGREDLYSVQGDDGSYRPVRKPFGVDVARSHLQKALTVGCYVLRTDNACNFGVLDFDDTNYSSSDAMNQVVLIFSRVLTHFGLDHLLERSGRKGLHLWVFFAVPVAASLVREFFRAVQAQAEGEMGISVEVEVFPKQDELQIDRETGQPTPGNLIKIPWGIHRVTKNRCVLVDSGLEQYPDMPSQYAAANACQSLTEADLRSFLDEYPVPTLQKPFRRMEPNGKRDEAFGKGIVPCTSKLFGSAVKEGERNLRFYDLAVREYREGVEESQAEQRLLGYNTKKCEPPETEKSVLATLKSVYRAGYANLRCEELKPFCAGPLCPIYCAQHNIAPKEFEKAASEMTPELALTDLVKIETDPPIWRMKVAGVSVQLEGADFLKYARFREEVFKALNIIYAVPRAPKESAQNAYERYLGPLLESCVIEAAPEDASDTGRLKELVIEWATDNLRPNARPEDVLLDGWVVFHPSHPGHVLFRRESFLQFLERRRIGSFRPTQIHQAFRDIGAKGRDESLIKIANKPVRLVVLPLEIDEEDGLKPGNPVTR